MSSDMNIDLHNTTLTINGNTRLITGNGLYTVGVDTVDGIDENGNAYEYAYTSNNNLDTLDNLRRRLNNSLRGEPNYNGNDIDVDSFYPNLIDNINDINTTRNLIKDVERNKIIEVLKREKNVNTKKCMYVEDLVKEIAKIMHVRL